MRTLCGFLLITSLIPFAVNARAEAPPASLLIFDTGHQWRLGNGINQVTGDRYATCLKSEVERPENRAMSQVIDIDYVSTQSSLRRALQLGAYAATFGVGTTFSFRISDVTSTEVQEERSSLFLRVRVTGKSRRFEVLEPSQTALDLMETDPSGRLFAKSCGDAVVDEIDDGAELFAVITLHASSKKAEEELTTTLKLASAGTGEIGGDLRKRLVDLSATQEAKIHLVQIGLASVPVPSFLDLAQLVEHARKFTSEVMKSGEAKPLRAHFIKFANLPAFQLAQERAKTKLLEFDDSIEVISDIVDAYEIARNRQKLVASALSNPRDFAGKDVPNTKLLQDYQKTVAAKVQSFADSARECARQAKVGEQCKHPADLSLPALPDIRPAPSCGVTEAEATLDDGCKERVRVGSACVCTRCKFYSRRIETRPTLLEKSCKGMMAGARGLVSYSGTVGLSSGNIDGWYYITPGNRARIGGSNIPLQFDFTGDDSITVPLNGEVTAKLLLEQCQSNMRAADLCWVAPNRQASHVIDIRVDIANELAAERISPTASHSNPFQGD
jgi:hypothetical protein